MISVQLVNDFLTEDKLKKLAQQKDLPDLIKQKLNEEINFALRSCYPPPPRTSKQAFHRNGGIAYPKIWPKNQANCFIKAIKRKKVKHP